jgi:LysM repeat protein
MILPVRARFFRIAAAVLVSVAGMAPAHAAPAPPLTVAVPATGTPLAAEAFSPAFLGMYRKLLEIDADIVRYANKYGVDPLLARAVCMFESGGNGQLTSGAGAHGYFQVMPSTFRLMKVETNVEAGIKYLSQMIKQFGREDYALAAYNGGPGRVAAERPMPLESLQYVLGVGHYRSVLKLHEPQVRAHAARLHLIRSHLGDDWWALSQQLQIPVIQLRLYNPFISDAALSRGLQLITYPDVALDDLVDVADDGSFTYRSRIGDNYINLAFAFGIDVDALRNENGLWRLQVLPAGMTLRFPQTRTEGFAEYTVREGEELDDVATRVGADPWQLVRDNSLWDQEVDPGMLLRVRRTPAPAPAPALTPAPARKVPAAVPASAPPPPRYRTHRVARGESLTSLARRYGTSISAIQRANGMGRRSSIRIGERLRIPR